VTGESTTNYIWLDDGNFLRAGKTDASYCTFTRVGAAAQDWSVSPSGSGDMARFVNCTFDTCGRIKNGQNTNGGTIVVFRDRGDGMWTNATTYTLTATSNTGRPNAPSGRFVVQLGGTTTVTATSPTTVTPSDGGAGGTFLPASIPLTADRRRATFRYTPAVGASGDVTISTTNDGGLVNPSPVTYTVTGTAATVATAVTSNSSSGTTTVGVPVTLTFAFSVADAVPPQTGQAVINGGCVLVNLSDSSGGGSFSPVKAWLSADAPSMTVDYTPGSTGTKTIVVTNDSGLSNPVNLSITVTS